MNFLGPLRARLLSTLLLASCSAGGAPAGHAPTALLGTAPGTTQGPTPAASPPFSIELWLSQVSRARWIQLIKIFTLIIVVATTTALVATRGCENCGDDSKQATTKRKKRKKRRKKKKKEKEPDVIRRVRNLF